MNNPSINNDAFRKALENLNDEQRAAVEHIEGPVLVIAGPGTGKTQILAARIGKILTETDTDAHNILCLTYTDAGTIAMRKRLFDFIGPDAYRVNIYTFHAFCNDIIQDNLDYFGKLNLEPVSELEQAILFRELIDSFPPDHKLKRFTGEVYFETGRLKNLFSTMKKENWSVEFIQSRIDDYISDLPLRDEYIYKKANAKKDIRPGDPKTEDIRKETERMLTLRAAVAEYPAYLERMKAAGRYDYDDMILWVLNAFKNDEQFLRIYQEKYQYILVDEYQDTSGSQNELLKMLIDFWDQPNVFVVGDDDQSIYRFQGANLSNIVDFANAYVDYLYKVVLTRNYRSTQDILDTSRTLIENNRERLTTHLNLDKNLVAANDALQAWPVKPQVRAYETPAHELVHVAEEIKEHIAKGVQPREIAVLFRNHAQAEALSAYLQSENVPVNIKRKEDILSLSFTEKIISILRYIAMEKDTPYSGDELLFEIMHYDFFDIAPIDIAKISVEVFRKNISFQNSTSNDRTKTSIRRMIAEMANPAKPDLFSGALQSPVINFSRDIEYWIRESFNYTLQELFEKIIVRAGVLKYIMRSSERGYYMEILSTLFDFLKEENRKDPEMDVESFVEMIDTMIRNGIRLEINRSSYNENGVNFMTVHGSKGLEFEYVYLIGTNRKIWDQKRSAGTRAYKFPDNILTTGDEGSELEESRRLFYVAVTRAKHSLYISYPSKDKNGKDLESSQFVAEIMQGMDYSVSHINVASDALMKFMFDPFREPEQPRVELLDTNYINNLLQGYTLSVTHLSNYLDCPLKFYFQNLVRVPSGKSPSATFGQAVHWALNKLFLKMKEEGNEFPPVSFFTDQFKWYMYRNRDSFSKAEFKLRLEYGDKILPAYYDTHIHQWNKVVLTEKKIKNVEVQGVPVTGNLDKIEFTGKQVNVVDYKTGKYKNALEKLRRPEEGLEAGGDYWRQAVFYKILIDHDHTNDWEAISSEFDFIEPVDQQYKKEKVVITPEDIAIVTGQITDTYRRILNHEFDKGCGKEECHWCNFVKSNFSRQEILLAEEE